MLGFVKNMVNGMDISPTGTKVGVITYSDRTHLEFHLNAHSDKTSLEQAISGIRYISGGTNTADALKYARETSFQNVNGARSNAAKIAIVITDGKSTSSIATSAEAQRLRQQGVTVFSVGVGAANKQELDAMATDPDNSHVFVVNNFDALKQINGELAQKACEGIQHWQELTKIDTIFFWAHGTNCTILVWVDIIIPVIFLSFLFDQLKPQQPLHQPTEQVLTILWIV